jgi:hypothetical protein
MSDDRLPTGLWVEAQLRHLTEKGIPYYIANKGAYASGTVLLKLNSLTDGCQVLTQIRDMDGNLGWMVALNGVWVAESEADAYIRRAVDRDPDVWVIEVEDRTKTNPFEGKLIS